VQNDLPHGLLSGMLVVPLVGPLRLRHAHVWSGSRQQFVFGRQRLTCMNTIGLACM
jgi:hypothetical protein